MYATFHPLATIGSICVTLALLSSATIAAVHISKIKSIIIDVKDRGWIVEGDYKKFELISLKLVKFIYLQTSIIQQTWEKYNWIRQLAKHIIVSN